MTCASLSQWTFFWLQIQIFFSLVGVQEVEKGNEVERGDDLVVGREEDPEVAVEGDVLALPAQGRTKKQKGNFCI